MCVSPAEAERAAMLAVRRSNRGGPAHEHGRPRPAVTAWLAALSPDDRWPCSPRLSEALQRPSTEGSKPVVMDDVPAGRGGSVSADSAGYG